MAHRPGEDIVVRRIPLAYPEGLDPVIIAGHPEESFVMIGMSLLLPYLEPYLIRSMREAKKHIDDPVLAAELDLFNAQEGQHYRQHIRFNEAIRPACPEALRALEEELDADYQRFTKERSLRFNLAYAEGFEAFTCATARFSFEHRLTERIDDPAARDLFRWHLIEEMEHRTVAFDAYDKTCRAYFYRLFIGLYAQWHLNRFMLRAAGILRDADPEGFRRKHGGAWAAWKRTLAFLWLAVRGFFPKLFKTYLPWYTPHSIPLPESARELGRHYTAMAK
ncbi:MAG: metal-dependent hydrolase [Byssovorax sp.]